MTARSIPLVIDPPKKQTATCRECGGPTERSPEMQGIAKCPACCAAYKPLAGPIRQPIQRTEEVRSASPIRVERTFLTPEASRAVGAPVPPPEESPMPDPAPVAETKIPCPLHPDKPASTGGICYGCGQMLRMTAKIMRVPNGKSMSLEVLRIVHIDELSGWDCYRRLKAVREALDAGVKPGMRVSPPEGRPPRPRKAPTRTTVLTERSADDVARAGDLLVGARAMMLISEGDAARMAGAALAEVGLSLEGSIHEGLVDAIAEAISKALRGAADQAVVRAKVALS